jgi:hypothetical protein
VHTVCFPSKAATHQSLNIGSANSAAAASLRKLAEEYDDAGAAAEQRNEFLWKEPAPE